jgi:hypothetical protein
MNELVSVFVAVFGSVGPSSHNNASLILARNPTPLVQMSQAPMGTTCVTPNGTCTISPRPINTPCFCGSVQGSVR